MTAQELSAQSERAREIFEIMRPCFHYAKAGTPDGYDFQNSLQGKLLMNAATKVAALRSAPGEGRMLEVFRAGFDAAVKLVNGEYQAEWQIDALKARAWVEYEAALAGKEG